MASMRVITTHGVYDATITPEDANGTDWSAVASEIAETLGGTGSRDFKVKADGIGWVAVNPTHIVAVEFHTDEVDY